MTETLFVLFLKAFAITFGIALGGALALCASLFLFVLTITISDKFYLK